MNMISLEEMQFTVVVEYIPTCSVYKASGTTNRAAYLNPIPASSALRSRCAATRKGCLATGALFRLGRFILLCNALPHVQNTRTSRRSATGAKGIPIRQGAGSTSGDTPEKLRLKYSRKQKEAQSTIELEAGKTTDNELEERLVSPDAKL